MALKRPHTVSFSKKNEIRPFTDTSSLEFWSQKNDASFFIIGQSTKKRPDGLVFARMFDGKVLDMCEFGIEGYVSISEIPVRLLVLSSKQSLEKKGTYRVRRQLQAIHH